MTTAIIIACAGTFCAAGILVWSLCAAASAADRCRKMPPASEWPDWRGN